MKPELLKVEFHKDAMRIAKGENPLHFVVSEVGAIIERMPQELMIEVITARKITVVISTE